MKCMKCGTTCGLASSGKLVLCAVCAIEEVVRLRGIIDWLECRCVSEDSECDSCTARKKAAKMK